MPVRISGLIRITILGITTRLLLKLFWCGSSNSGFSLQLTLADLKGLEKKRANTTFLDILTLYFNYLGRASCSRTRCTSTNNYQNWIEEGLTFTPLLPNQKQLPYIGNNLPITNSPSQLQPFRIYLFRSNHFAYLISSLIQPLIFSDSFHSINLICLPVFFLLKARSACSLRSSRSTEALLDFFLFKRRENQIIKKYVKDYTKEEAKEKMRKQMREFVLRGYATGDRNALQLRRTPLVLPIA